MFFYDSARMQGNISSTTCDVVYAFFVTTLIGLLQVKYQNKNASPFETHPTTMRTFVITMWTYSLATAGKSVTKKYGANCCYKIFGHVSIISGALSSVSLAAVFLPSSLNSPIMFITSAVLFAIVAQLLYQTICQWFYWKIADAVAQVLEILTTRFMGWELMEQQRVLV
ncbi:hypothetical protein RHSIM_Rhsim07G0031400 [Rhododendron simsii]|uniref:Uncharacterized protein n=1 Tax=Rhododendron simsii TaxID=118357 RepID=A0A834GQD3_RHOSS|nr:hypothetical protein RHSIM_Rhsim07G0031400 [Rhododendron simsii]